MDCLEGMAQMDSESVDLMFTSPPYPGVNNMWGELFQEEHFEQAHDFLTKVWIESIRVFTTRVQTHNQHSQH